MLTRNWIVLFTALVTSSTALASGQVGISVSHYDTLEGVKVESKAAHSLQKPSGIGPVNLSFSTLGRAYDLQLEPNAKLLAAIPPEQRLDSNIPYRGVIAGVPGSWARIVMTRGMPAGLIWDGQALYAIEIPGDNLVDSSAPIAYRLADAIVEPGAIGCDSAHVAVDGETAYESVIGEVSEATSNAADIIGEITVGAVGDYEFTASMGPDAQSAILTRLNNVDGIFSQQIGVQIRVPVIETFTDSSDPFSDTNDPSALLDEVKDYRVANESQRYEGLTHLYTGRDLAGSTAGNANQGALCAYGFGVGLSEGKRGAALDSLIAAHEIGHNFGAPHDGEAGSACQSEPSTYLMATTLSGSDQFSACSIAQMQDDIAQAACITPLLNTDISISFSNPAPTVLLGDTAEVTLNIINNGSGPAQNVSVDITLPSNVSLVSVSGEAAICDSGAGTANCQLGEIAGGGATSVVLATDAVAAGTGVFAATVSASADDQPANNSDTFQLTVDPAVNLMVEPPASAQVMVNNSATVLTTLQNLSSLEATGVTLSVTLDSGLQADSATWSIGTCSITAQQISCQADVFDAQSESTLSVGVTAISPGTWNYAVTLASAETDTDPADNSSQGSVSVSASSGGGEVSGGGGAENNGGGGGSSWLLLLMLVWRAYYASRR